MTVTSSLTIVRGTNNKPVASESLAKYFEAARGLEGQLFIGYPVIAAADGKHPIDAVYISPVKGVVVFDLVDGVSLGNYKDRQDDAATRLESRLLSYRELVSKRRLIIPISTLTYAPAVQRYDREPGSDYSVENFESLGSKLDEIQWQGAEAETYSRTLSAIQSISTIRKARATRRVGNAASRGAKLQQLEESIATLDNLQGKAVIETVQGVQRIRGLAGSGKTIVLALKAAYLHAQHPEWRIAVTFNTRSLKAQFRRLINNFSIEQAGEEPNWGALRIISGWGAGGGQDREGVYHQFCVDNSVEYLDFNTAKMLYGQSRAFQDACASALAATPEPRKSYDVILVDEAQDFPPEFLRLCYSTLEDPKRLVYAYDELQNLSSSGLPSATEIFGVDAHGSPNVSFEPSSYDLGARRDIILEKCYRNSRPVLVTAHALGFGTYRKPPAPGRLGLVQMFDQPSLWTEIGYRIKDGELEEGSLVALERTADTSPAFLENHSPLDDLIQFYAFRSEQEQADWVAAQVVHNLTVDELRHDDIVVINPDPFTTRRNVGPIRKVLLERNVMSHVAGVDTVADVFFRTDGESVTFTGIHRAKGNEAAMVYVVNAHECYDATVNLAQVRNMLFTAVTRSKAWVRILGVGPQMLDLVQEYETLRGASFELRFVYPTERERTQLQIVHRDMTREEAKSLKRQRESLVELVADLEAGRVFKEDLDESLLNRLGKLLGNGGD